MTLGRHRGQLALIRHDGDTTTVSQRLLDWAAILAGGPHRKLQPRRFKRSRGPSAPGWDEVQQHVDKSETGLIGVRRESFAEFATGHRVEVA